jgi:type II secretory pathway pseudopilin PulG
MMRNSIATYRLTAKPRQTRRGMSAFSLMEVLIALGIFAVGLVAVAAVFPTAIAVQRETVRDLAGQRTVVNARGLIQAMARSAEAVPSNRFSTLTYLHDPIIAGNREGTLKDFTRITSDLPVHASTRTGFPGGVQPMLDQPLPPTAQQHTMPAFAEMSNTIPLNAAKSFHKLFSEEVRSFPKNIPQTDQRDYYWFPMIQVKDLAGGKPSWYMFLMIMQRRGTEAVPQVRAVEVVNASGSIITIKDSGAPADPLWLDNDFNNNGLPDLIQPGDWVLGDDGSTHRVLLAEGSNQLTIESAVPPTGLRLLYYAVAIDRVTGTPKRESRSPIVRIEQFELIVDQP